MKQLVLAWDVPTRVFHWLLVVSFAGDFLTAESERFTDAAKVKKWFKRNCNDVLGRVCSAQKKAMCSPICSP